MKDESKQQRGERRRWPALLVVALVAIVALAVLGGAKISVAGAEYRHAQRDIVEFGNDVNIPADEIVYGDVVVFGGDVTVHGTVEGSAVVFGGDLHIYPEGSVAKDTVSFGGSIINESQTTPSKPHVMPMPSVEPMPTMAPMPMPAIPVIPPSIPVPYHVFHLGGGGVWASFIVLDLLVTLLVSLVFPPRTRNVEEHLVAQPLAAFVLGCIAPIALAVVLIVLAVLVVTIPLIPVAIVATLLAYWIGKAAVASFLGRRLLEAAKVADPQPLAAIGVGLAVMLILTGPTPIWFAVLMFSTIGAVATGAALLSFMRTRPGLLGPAPATYAAMPGPYTQPFTPPSGPAASGPPAVPQ